MKSSAARRISGAVAPKVLPFPIRSPIPQAFYGGSSTYELAIDTVKISGGGSYFGAAFPMTGASTLTGWTSPEAAMRTFGLETTYSRSAEILREIFGADAEVIPTLSVNPESAAPSFVLQMRIPREDDGLRDQFVDRYIREVPIPATAPMPVLTWRVANAVRSD